MKIHMKIIELNHNQLVGCNLFLGYHKACRHESINYYLLGSYMKSNVINLNATYSICKKFISIVKNMILKNGKIWLVHEQSDALVSCLQLRQSNDFFKNVYVYERKWTKGTISNFKKIKIIKKRQFPNALFIPNMQQNYYAINECFAKQIPSFCLADTMDNANGPFLSIPANSRDFRGLLYFYYMIISACRSGTLNRSSDFLFSVINKARTKIMHSIVNRTIKRWNFVLLYFGIWKNTIKNTRNFTRHKNFKKQTPSQLYNVHDLLFVEQYVVNVVAKTIIKNSIKTSN